MKTSKEFKKLLQFLEEQNKKECEGYNQGVDVPLLFKITKDPKTGKLLVDGKSIYEEDFTGYFSDLSDLPDLENYVYLKLSDIPKEELQPILPEQYIPSDDEDCESEDYEYCDDDEDCDEDFDDNDSDLDIGDIMGPEELEHLRKLEEEDNSIEIDSVIDSIEEYMKSNDTDELYILLNYNLYQYEGNIFVVDPGRCFDRPLDNYGMNIILKSIESLGL